MVQKYEYAWMEPKKERQIGKIWRVVPGDKDECGNDVFFRYAEQPIYNKQVPGTKRVLLASPIPLYARISWWKDLYGVGWDHLCPVVDQLLKQKAQPIVA